MRRSETQFWLKVEVPVSPHPDCVNRTYSPTNVIEAEMKIGEVVLGLATSHCQKIAGTFSPPCCLVFVGQDRQAWVPGPLLRKETKNM